MKKTKQYISLLLAAFMATGLSSCIKEDYAGSSDETATVNLVFDTRANGDATAPVDENEGIKTMRVYITDEQGNVEFNIYQEYTDDQAQRTLTILGVPVGTKNFYVIANEKSVGLSAEELGEGVVTTIDDEFLNQIITNPDGNAYFPKMRNQIGELGLPITGMKTDVVVSEDNDEPIQIDVTHAVAKVVLNVTNTSSEAIGLTGFSLGEFFVNKTNLFPDRVTIPAGISSEGYSQTFDAPVTIPVNNEDTPVEVFTCYFYETPVGEDYENRFTLKLENNNGLDLEAKNFLTGVTAIERNTQVVINATISRETAVDVTVTLNWRVKEWDRESIDVPAFD